LTSLSYQWRAAGREHELLLVPVPGTNGQPYLFGRGSGRRPIEVSSFYLSATPVTQALWLHITGGNPAKFSGLDYPVENVSWEHINAPGGFLDRLNSSDLAATIAGDQKGMRFRLPSETEWEYAARGGPGWQDGFVYSGSNDPDEVAWYGPRWTKAHDLLGWTMVRRLRLFRGRPTRIHDVAMKQPNQLGLYDMSGNVWEWCQDICTDDLAAVPEDGSPYLGPGAARRLRGGCHHNWNFHCSVSWRYGISPAAHDGCIGLRLVLAPA